MRVARINENTAKDLSMHSETGFLFSYVYPAVANFELVGFVRRDLWVDSPHTIPSQRNHGFWGETSPAR
jgi:hypothetical protein